MIIKNIDRLYPVDAFPSITKDALIELVKNVQAPEELVGPCLLSALSAVAQRYIKVRLPIGGQPKPVSLFVLVVAASGDRKTTVDNLVFRSLRDYDDQQQEMYERAMKHHRCAHRVWAAQERRLVRQATGGDYE